MLNFFNERWNKNALGNGQIALLIGMHPLKQQAAENKMKESTNYEIAGKPEQENLY